MFATLGAIKKAIVYLDEKICPVIRSLENELDIFRLDDNGDTPLVSILRNFIFFLLIVQRFKMFV